MTFNYNNVYLNNVSSIAGKYESEGPLKNYYDKTYNDFYINTKSWEDAEVKLLTEAIDLVIKKENRSADLLISGDLLNQIVASNYTASTLNIPYLGIYSACSTITEGMLIASNFIESGKVKNIIVSTSSHNNSAEKQFRYPIEYGSKKRKMCTFTTTGGTALFLSDKKSDIKIKSATIGKVVDMGVSDVNNMGAVMAPAAANTLYTHLIDNELEPNYYDLILTGDLGMYGKDIFKEYMEKEYNIKLNNYDDTACMIYDINKQHVYAGGSGPACMPLVFNSYILPKMKNKEIKKVLLLATGALMSPAMVNLKKTIPAISHAISLEVI